MKRKVIMIILFTVVSISFTACGGQSDSQKEKESDIKQSKTAEAESTDDKVADESRQETDDPDGHTNDIETNDNTANDSKEPTEDDRFASYIDGITLFGTENGTVYWDVHLAITDEWNEDDILKEELALYAIKQCITKNESKDAASWSVMGYTSDGNVAFVWGGLDGIDEIAYYENGMPSHNYGLIPEQIEYIGIL